MKQISCFLMLAILGALLFGCSDSASKSRPLIKESDISRRIKGKDSASTIIRSNEGRFVALEISKAAVYIPSREVTTQLWAQVEVSPKPEELPFGFVASRAIEVQLEARDLPNAIAVSFEGSSKAKIFHKVGETWVPLATTYANGKVYGVSSSASPFALALPPEPAKLQAASGSCYVVGFTGWTAEDATMAQSNPLLSQISLRSGNPIDVIKDPWEPEDYRIALRAGPTEHLLDALAVGLNVTDVRVWRFHERGSALDEIIRHAQSGERIVLAGHSAGGAAAVDVAWNLSSLGIPVELLIELDTYRGQIGADLIDWVYFDSRGAPPNVRSGINFYQEQSLYYWGSAQKWAGQGKYVNREVPVAHEDMPSKVLESPIRKDEAASYMKAACGSSIAPPPSTPCDAQSAKMLIPEPQTVLPTSGARFEWSPGTCLDTYDIWVGSSPNQADIYDMADGSRTAITLPVSIQADGQTVYVKLVSSKSGGGPLFVEYYTYTASRPPGSPAPPGPSQPPQPGPSQPPPSQPPPAGPAPPVPPQPPSQPAPPQPGPQTCSLIGSDMSSPAPGSILAGPSVTFSWTQGGTCLDRYDLWVGTAVNSANIYDRVDGPGLSQTVGGIPNCQRIFVRLVSSRFGDSTLFFIREYTYQSFCPPTPTVPVAPSCSGSGSDMVSPVSGSTLSASNVTFSWTQGGNCLDRYDIWVGTSPNTANVFDRVDGAGLSQSVTGIPNCQTIYVRLVSSKFGDPAQFFVKNYTYKSFCP